MKMNKNFAIINLKQKRLNLNRMLVFVCGLIE